MIASDPTDLSRLRADAAGVHLAYDQPSSVFASLGSEGINKIAVELDAKIGKVAQAVCRGA